MISEELWRGEFWTEGYFISTVGQYGNEETLRDYVRNQEGDLKYKEIYQGQLQLF